MKYNFLLSIKSKRNSFYTVLLLFQISIVCPLIELFIYTCFMHNSIICETDFFTYNHIYFSFLTSLADSGKCDVLRNIVTLSNLVYSFFFPHDIEIHFSFQIYWEEDISKTEYLLLVHK